MSETTADVNATITYQDSDLVESIIGKIPKNSSKALKTYIGKHRYTPNFNKFIECYKNTYLDPTIPYEMFVLGYITYANKTTEPTTTNDLIEAKAKAQLYEEKYNEQLRIANEHIERVEQLTRDVTRLKNMIDIYQNPQNHQNKIMQELMLLKEENKKNRDLIEQYQNQKTQMESTNTQYEKTVNSINDIVKQTMNSKQDEINSKEKELESLHKVQQLELIESYDKYFKGLHAKIKKLEEENKEMNIAKEEAIKKVEQSMKKELSTQTESFHQFKVSTYNFLSTITGAFDQVCNYYKSIDDEIKTLSDYIKAKTNDGIVLSNIFNSMYRPDVNRINNTVKEKMAKIKETDIDSERKRSIEDSGMDIEPELDEYEKEHLRFKRLKIKRALNLKDENPEMEEEEDSI